jgi:hypothetical protein
MDKMARKNELVTWARPPIPEFNLIERTLGTMIHDAVFRGRRRDKPCGMQKTDPEERSCRNAVGIGRVSEQIGPRVSV